MTISRKRLVSATLLLSAAAALTACGSNGSDLGPANAPSMPAVTLSAFTKSLFTMFTNDTSVATEINDVMIDTSSEDPADANYASLFGA